MLWGAPVWEIAVFAAAARLAWQFGWRYGSGTCAEEVWLAVLAIDVTLASSIACVLSFAHANSTAAYLGVAAALAAATALVRRRDAREAAADLATALAGIAPFRHPRLCGLLAALFVPALFLSIRPIADVDSLYALHSLLDWTRNRSNPYTFRFQFPAFWELNYLPHLVISRTDWWLNLVSLKGVLLVGASLLVAARELGLPSMPAVLVTASFLSFRQMWWEHSGVATAKNDPLRAAGVILLAIVLLRAARPNLLSTDTALFAFGAAFVTEKSSGPVLAGFAFLVFWILRRPGWRAVGAVALFVLATTGHYYVHNLIAFGNPVYPIQVTIAGHTLPGTGDPSFTSILHRAGESRPWRLLLLPEGGVSPAGVLFPLVWIVALAAALWQVCRAAAAWFARREPLSGMAWLGALLLLGWAVYLASPFTAGSGRTDFAYLENDLVSLRYASGELALSEAFLAALLYAWAGPVPVIALASLQMASRLWLLYRWLPFDTFPPVMIGRTALACAIVLWGLARIVRPRLRPLLSFAFATAALFATAPWLVERNRAQWTAWWHPIYAPLREMPASDLFLVEDPRAGLVAGHYLLAGARFQHDVRVGPEDRIGQWRPRFLARLISPGEPKPDFAAFSSRWAAHGYEPVIAVEHGVLLERMERVAAPQSFTALQIATGMPAALEPKERGEFILSTSTGRVYRIGAERTRVLEFRGGERMRVANAGPQGAGCDYVLQAGNWTLETPAAIVNGDPDFREAARTGSLGSRFVAVSAGASRIEPLADAEGPFLRIHAQNPTRWLAVVDHFPAGPSTGPYTIRARVRCPKAGVCKLNYVGPRSLEVLTSAAGEWQELSIPLRQAPVSSDYVAAGRGDSGPGDFFDLRELAILDGFYPAIPAAK